MRSEHQRISRPVGLGAGTLAAFLGQLITHGAAYGGSNRGSTVGYATIISIVVGGGSMYWYEKSSARASRPSWEMYTVTGWALLGFVLVNGASTLAFASTSQYAGFLFLGVGVLSSVFGLVILTVLILVLRQFNRRRDRDEESRGGEEG